MRRPKFGPCYRVACKQLGKTIFLITLESMVLCRQNTSAVEEIFRFLNFVLDIENVHNPYPFFAVKLVLAFVFCVRFLRRSLEVPGRRFLPILVCAQNRKSYERYSHISRFLEAA